MKTRHTPTPLPRSFTAHPDGKGIIAEHDIAVWGHERRGAGRLRAKLLVFKSPRAMRAFSRKALGIDNDEAVGFVSDLSREVITIGNIHRPGREHILYVDPRYFCLICLVRGHLTMDIITHEACHAGIFFSQRSRMRWPNQDGAASEAICYPTGRIAAAINRFLHDSGLYE